MTQPLNGGMTVADRGYPAVAVPPQTPVPPPAAPTTHDVQAEADGVDPGLIIDFLGRKFRLAEGVSLVPLMKFALVTKAGVDTNDMDALAAMYEVIHNCIHRPVMVEPDSIPVEGTGMSEANPRAGQEMVDPNTGRLVRDEREWQRFEDYATDMMADDEDLNDFLQKAIEAISARPRKRRGNSSGSSPAMSEKSRAASFSPAIPPGGRVPPGADELTSIADVVRSTD